MYLTATVLETLAFGGTMFLYCVAYQSTKKESVNEALCEVCAEKFERASCKEQLNLKRTAGEKLRVHSVMSFEWSRQMLLNAKIGWDVGAVRALGQIFRRKIQDFSLDGFDVISSVPQSSYSRLRGRFNLTDYLCECIRVEYRIPQIYLQTPFLWRFIKQSFRKSTQRKIDHRIKLKEKVLKEKNIRCLIVDDIVTTGSTILTVAEALPKDWQVEGCTFARA